MKQKKNKYLLIYNKYNFKTKTFKLVKFIKKISILYSLLVFSKKRLKNDFTNFSSNLFFILLLPLLGYILDKQNFLSNNNNNFESFFSKTLPGLNYFKNKNFSYLTWETFNYTDYFKKINWNNLKKISYSDDSIFISFNSNLYNQKNYIGIYNNTYAHTKKNFNSNNLDVGKNNIELTKYYLSGRYFNKFFKTSFCNQKNFLLNNNKTTCNNLILKKNNFGNKIFLNFRNWQSSFYKLDYISFKLDNVFYSNNKFIYNNLISKKNNLLNIKKIKYKNNDLIKPLFNNVFYYKTDILNNTIIENKSNILNQNNIKTIIEKKNNKLHFEIFNKKITYSLSNYRFFHYKIYNKLFLFKNFLNYQINNFYYTNNSNSFYNFLLNKEYNLINTVKTNNKSVENNKKFFKLIKKQIEPNWQNLIRKDLKNIGSFQNKKFIYLNKLKNKSLHLNKNIKENNYINYFLEKNKTKNNIIFLNSEIKNHISLQNRDNINLKIKKNIKNKKIKNKIYYSNFTIKKQKSNFLTFDPYLTKIPKNKKKSLFYFFERDFFLYLENLKKKNILLKLDKSSSTNNLLFFVFNNKKQFTEDKFIKNTKFKNIKLLKNRIIERKSSLLKRKLSGYLYPDIQIKNIFFINKFNLFNNSFIQIKGPKSLVYKKFKKFSNNLFFLHNKKNNINFDTLKLNFINKINYPYLKNNLIKQKIFFGSEKMDFGLGFDYDKNNYLELLKIDESNYKPNLNLIYNIERKDSKTPFSWQYPIKEDWLMNNNYFNSISYNKKNFYVFNLKKDFKLKTKYNYNKYFLETYDLNENFLLPISYKSYFKYNKNYDFLNIYYSNFIKNFNNLFNNDLYEIISFKKWSLITQLSFLLIFLKLINNLKENYGESFVTAFKIFFNNFEFDALINLKIEVVKTIKSKKIKFNNLIGGKLFLQEFNQTILLLKNSKYGFQSNFNIQKPDFSFNSILINKNKFFLYSKTKNYKNSFIFVNQKQKDIIYKFIYNPIYFLFLNYKFINLKFNNNLSIKNLKNKIYIKGFLLVGPPGTGKTILVKALSGEAEVPIVLESGEKLSKLNSSNDMMSENAKGALELKNLFKRAKKISPCILFLDEIDSVGKNRKDVLIDYRKKRLLNFSTTNSSNFLSNYKISINSSNSNKLNYDIINNNFNFDNSLKNLKNINENLLKDLKNNSNELNIKSLSMLTQLLCELDGLKDRRDLVIIGATNRPKILDPALIRPGRLNKIIYIDLPGKKKRFELLKFYSKNKINNINWEFFANQTTGLSAAHLSSALNISLLKKIYNLINLNKQNKFKLLNNINKSSVIQDFEIIEYGIQTIKFRNSSFKSKCFDSGVLFNSLLINYNYYNQLKLINIVNFSNLLINYNLKKDLKKNSLKNSWLNLEKKSNTINSLKQILRTIFYKKNRKFIRTLYLLNNKTNINNLITKKIKSNYSIVKFNHYINRIFKVHIFSCCILIFSTYIINNPLIFSFNFFYNYSTNLLTYNLYNTFLDFKSNNILKYKLIYYNFKLTNNINFVSSKKFFYENNKIFSFNKKTNNKKTNNKKINKNIKNYINLYSNKSLKKNSEIQQLMFSDSLFLNRVSNYIGGKALIFTLLKKPIFDFNTINLWFSKNKLNSNIKKKLFIKQYIKKLITKEDFENYLFFIITGKVCETKMLLNTNSKNVSSFAVDELKEIGWLLNIMINKNFFYKPLKFKILRQNLIQKSKNSFKNINKKMIKNKKSNIRNNKKLFILNNKFDKSFILNKKRSHNLNYKSFNFWTLLPYWWEPNLKVKNINIMHWSIFFKKSKKVNFLKSLIKNSSKYYYFYTISTSISNKFLNYNTFINKNNKLINIKSDPFFNSNNKTVNFYKYEINWNNFLIIEYYNLVSDLILNCFNDIFNLLNLNSELMDYFIYYILCNESFYDFELNKISLKYYKFL